MALVAGYLNSEAQVQKFGHILSFIQQCLDLIRVFQVRFEDCRRVRAGKTLADCEAARALESIKDLSAQKASGSCYKNCSRHFVNIKQRRQMWESCRS